MFLSFFFLFLFPPLLSTECLQQELGERHWQGWQESNRLGTERDCFSRDRWQIREAQCGKSATLPRCTFPAPLSRGSLRQIVSCPPSSGCFLGCQVWSLMSFFQTSLCSHSLWVERKLAGPGWLKMGGHMWGPKARPHRFPWKTLPAELGVLACWGEAGSRRRKEQLSK